MCPAQGRQTDLLSSVGGKGVSAHSQPKTFWDFGVWFGWEGVTKGFLGACDGGRAGRGILTLCERGWSEPSTAHQKGQIYR